jgi:hypothetical protein
MATRLRLVAGLAAIAIAAGLAVAVVVLSPGDQGYDPRIDAYRKVSDDLHIVVFVGIGYGDPIVDYDVIETADSVTVTVHAQNRSFGPGTFKNLVRYTGIPVTVTLDKALATRVVQDASGARIPEITCPDGTFGCFVGR